MTETPDQPVVRPGPPPARWKRALLTGVKWALFALVAYFVGRALVGRFADMAWSDLALRPGWAVAAFLTMLVALAWSSVPYHLLLKRFGGAPGGWAVLASIWVSRIGVYVPGKVGALMGTVWLLRRYRVPAQRSAGAAVMCDGISTIVGLLLAVPLTLWTPVASRLPLAWLWCLILVAVGLVCLHPRVFGGLCNLALRKLGRQPFDTLPRARDLLGPALAIALQLVLAGSALWMLCRAATDVPLSALPLLISGNALAGVAGFLSFFAPAGLGVQEGILIIILGPVAGPSAAAVITVVRRLLRTVGDVLMAGAGLLLLRVLGAAPDDEDAGATTEG